MARSQKMVYFFGGGKAEGKASMKVLLGGKGANLAEMSALGLPVPPGFTISTKVCDLFYKMKHHYPAGLDTQIEANIKKIEKLTGKTFGKGDDPLLVSVRSGAAISMPGMMDTVLNLGLNDQTLASLIKITGNERFALDAYRRFMQMFGDVVLGIEHHEFEAALEKVKIAFGKKKKVRNIAKLKQEALNKAVPDTALDPDALKQVIAEYKRVYKRNKKTFPQDPRQQLRQAIFAVFDSWNNPRAIKYRQIHDIRGLIGTAVNVQTMVFGNSGDTSATGVAFTRDPSTGETKYFYGEYLVNAQGEDVVAGIRTPHQITTKGSREWAKSCNISETERKKNYPSLQEAMPACFKQLDVIRKKLEKHYHDMQDLEFTIEHGKLYMLQTRNGKRTGAAAVKIAADMVKEKLITEKQALLRIEPHMLDQLLHPVFDQKSEKAATPVANGLPASPGAATGQIVFSADDAEKWVKAGKKVILCRIETSPEDIVGMHVSEGILTARGGMTSHAAVVARGWGKCCVSGCGDAQIDSHKKIMKIGNKTFKEGQWISLNGSNGNIYPVQVKTVNPSLSGPFGVIMKLADKYRKLAVRTNADTPEDTALAVEFGAEGIGLCRTEHMFFEGRRIVSFRRFILVAQEVMRLKEEFNCQSIAELKKQCNPRIKGCAKSAADIAQYEKALKELLTLQRKDFEGMFRALKGKPCTIRLLDPPLHEFLPHDSKGQAEMAKSMKIKPAEIKKLVDDLHEFNPMLGHRGCRLGISYPEITAMQARAIVEAALKVKGSQPEIMIPLIGSVKEFDNQKAVILSVIEEIKNEKKLRKLPLDIKIGTMIEVPRAAMTADEIAKNAEFFSFGTNDLTQMTCGFSRDDAGTFLGDYVNKDIYEYDPFQSLDQEGVGKVVETAVKLGRKTRKNIKLGICGEHGGEPKSVEFCHRIGLNYVSCSPYRVPIARLAAAQAAIR